MLSASVKHAANNALQLGARNSSLVLCGLGLRTPLSAGVERPLRMRLTDWFGSNLAIGIGSRPARSGLSAAILKSHQSRPSRACGSVAPWRDFCSPGAVVLLATHRFVGVKAVPGALDCIH